VPVLRAPALVRCFGVDLVVGVVSAMSVDLPFGAVSVSNLDLTS
jgi:hypothetical protein